MDPSTENNKTHEEEVETADRLDTILMEQLTDLIGHSRECEIKLTDCSKCQQFVFVRVGLLLTFADHTPNLDTVNGSETQVQVHEALLDLADAMHFITAPTSDSKNAIWNALQAAAIRLKRIQR